MGELRLYYKNVTSDSLRKLKNLQNLEKIRLPRLVNMEELAPALQLLPNLQEVSLGNGDTSFWHAGTEYVESWVWKHPDLPNVELTGSVEGCE